MFERMQREHARLVEKACKIRKELQGMPEGKLVCVSNGKYQKWYRSDGRESVYIARKNRALAEELAWKNFLVAQLKDIEDEQRAIEFYLRHYPSKKRVVKLMNEELLQSYFTPLSQELREWMQVPYEKNQYHPEGLVHKVGSLTVRSKSESMIAMALLKHRIPFRYECALHLGEKVVFPDFTIRHPKTGELFYWEHFGLMDHAGYIQNACGKMQLYMSHHIVPTIQLITTYETKEHPLTMELIEKQIEDSFL